MRHFKFVWASFNHFVYFKNFIVTFLVIWGRLNFVVLVVASIDKKMSECWESHCQVVFVVNLDTSYLNTKKWHLRVLLWNKVVRTLQVIDEGLVNVEPLSCWLSTNLKRCLGILLVVKIFHPVHSKRLHKSHYWNLKWVQILQLTGAANILLHLFVFESTSFVLLMETKGASDHFFIR